MSGGIKAAGDIAIFISVGARLFRRGVLQSGGGAPVWRRLFARVGRRGA